MADWKFKTKEEIPQDLLADVKEVDGQFVVSVVSKQKVTEFRDNNIALKTELETTKAQKAALEAAAGTDPAAIASELTELREISQRVKDGKLTAKTDIESEVANRMKSSKEAFEVQIRTLSEKNTQLEKLNTETTQKLNRSIVDRHVTDAALAKDSGINPQALGHVLQQAYDVFNVTPDGKLVAKKGDVVMYGADGINSITPKEWLAKLLQDAPYFALPSTGGGAANGDKNGLGGLSAAEFQKLSPTERLTHARRAKA